MDPKFQTSFIPQKPIVTGSSSSYPSGVQSINIFNIIATILFVGGLILCGGLFAYKQLLHSQIADADKELVAARNAFDPDTIHNLIDISTRITSTKQLLESHIAVSGLFNLLQSLTVSNVRFSNFSYSKKDNALVVSMDGESGGYNTLAAQAMIFSQNEFVKNPTFSDFDLAQNGNVTFKFSAVIDPNLVSYKKAMAALPLTQSLPVSNAPKI